MFWHREEIVRNIREVWECTVATSTTADGHSALQQVQRSSNTPNFTVSESNNCNMILPLIFYLHKAKLSQKANWNSFFFSVVDTCDKSPHPWPIALGQNTTNLSWLMNVLTSRRISEVGQSFPPLKPHSSRLPRGSEEFHSVYHTFHWSDVTWRPEWTRPFECGGSMSGEELWKLYY